MPTYRFPSVTLQAARKKDGKRQQKTFSQTLNPFNKAADGTPKTREQIMAELREEADRWKNEP
jgi:hypothetical protein